MDRCYVIGSGPSLNQLSYLEYLDMKRNIVILCNQAYKVFDKVDYHVFLDNVMWDMMKEDKYEIKGKVITHKRNDTPYRLESDFGFDKETLHTGGNSGYLGINLALHLDVKEIVLVGFDISFDNAMTRIKKNFTDVDSQRRQIELLIVNINKLLLNKGEKRIINLRGNNVLGADYCNNLFLNISNFCRKVETYSFYRKKEFYEK